MNHDAQITGQQAALYLKESRQLIYRWRRLGHIKPVAYDHRGAPLYRLGDILETELLMRSSALSSRNPERKRASTAA